MWRHEPEWPLLGRQRSTVYGICDDYFGLENARIQFRQGENHSITVGRFGKNVSGHGSTSKLFALGNSGFSKEVFKKYSVIGFFLFVVRIHHGECFPGHLLEISHGQYQRGGNGASDSELRDGGWTLRKHLPRGRKKRREHYNDQYRNTNSNYARHLGDSFGYWI
jgi:hypothetical protein